MVDEDLLYHSCRICSVTNLDGDFVALFEEDKGFYKQLTTSGELYEELIGLKVLPTEPAYYSKCICSSCDLQMKLFKSLKERAFKTIHTLKSQSYQGTKNEHSISTETKEETQQEHELFEIVSDALDGNDSNQEFNCNDENDVPGKQNSALSQDDFGCIKDQEDSDKIEDMNSMLIVYNSNYDDINDELNVVIRNVNAQQGESTTKDRQVDKDIKDTCNYIEVQYFDNKRLSNSEETSQNVLPDERETYATNDRKTSYKCKECVFEFPTLRRLRVHRQENHPLTHRCTVCSKALRSAEALEVHMKHHLGLPAYSCKQCNKTFKQKVHYQYHIRRHNDERNFNCEVCGKGYVSKWDLTTHMRQHSGIRPYTCTFENCGKQFYTEQHLKMHMYYHNEEKNFECDICHGMFVSPTVLHTHRQSIHFERRFECTICGKKFRRKHQLEIHTFTHEKDCTISDNELLSENDDDSFHGNDIIVDMAEQAEPANEIYFENFIEVDQSYEDAFIKDAIESCAESTDNESGFNCYNIYGS